MTTKDWMSVAIIIGIFLMCVLLPKGKSAHDSFARWTALFFLLSFLIFQWVKYHG